VRYSEDEFAPKCDGVACLFVAKWSIANIHWQVNAGRQGPQSITAAFACGVHLNQVLRAMQWEMDVVEIRDLTEPVGRS
jgi:hypothetical protein